jgi:DnaJ-class molecular chaperone
MSLDRTITTLDGRRINLHAGDGEAVLYPGQEIRIGGEGMPSSKSGVKGDLICELKIRMPTRVSREKKAELKEVLRSL